MSQLRHNNISFLGLVSILCGLLCLALQSSDAFAPLPSSTMKMHRPPSATPMHPTTASTSTAQFYSSIDSLLLDATTTTTTASSTNTIAALTLDPTTVLSDVLGALLGTPAILLVPVVAALGLASLIAFFIVSYANPEVDNDE